MPTVEAPPIPDPIPTKEAERTNCPRGRRAAEEKAEEAMPEPINELSPFLTSP